MLVALGIQIVPSAGALSSSSKQGEFVSAQSVKIRVGRFKEGHDGCN